MARESWLNASSIDRLPLAMPRRAWSTLLSDSMDLSPNAPIAFAKSSNDVIDPGINGFIKVKLPRNASGKVLKRVLREPHWEGQVRRVAGA